MGYFGKGGAGGMLAATGTVTLGGIALQQLWLLAAALVLVGSVAVASRFGFRRNKGVGQR